MGAALTSSNRNHCSLYTINVSTGGGDEALVPARKLLCSNLLPIGIREVAAPGGEGGETVAVSPACEDQAGLGVGVGPARRVGHSSIYPDGSAEDSFTH